MMWSNWNPDDPEAETEVYLAYSGSADQQFPKPTEQLSQCPEDIQMGHATWAWIEKTLTFLRTCHLAKEIIDQNGNCVAELSLQVVFAAVVSINQRMIKKLKHARNVTKYTTVIPDIPERKQFTLAPELVTTQANRTMLKIRAVSLSVTLPSSTRSHRRRKACRRNMIRSNKR